MAQKKTAPLPPKRKPATGKIQDKKDLAKLLFTKNELSQKDVAKRVGISENTMTKWVRDNHWEEQRKSLLVTREEQLRNLLDQLSELNNAIKKRPEGHRYADNKEGDTLVKITAAIKKLSTETGLNEVIEINGKVISFVMNNFPENLKLFTNILDAFVKQHL